MQSNAFQLLFMLFMLMSGGRENRDLLDMMSSDSYWRAKSVTVSTAQLLQDAEGGGKVSEELGKLVEDLGSAEFARRDAAKGKLLAAGIRALPALKVATASTDPEVAAAAEELMASLSLHLREGDVRRLMAIRTLGEKKEPTAVPLLKTLAESKAPFVGEYAQRALAEIAGARWEHADRHGAMAGDAEIMPKDTGIVGQTTGVGIAGFTIDRFVADVLGDKKPAEADAMGVKIGAADVARLTDRATRELLNYAERIGNIRADGATVAVSSDIGGNRNWFALSVRGEYDAHAIAGLVADLLPKENNGFFSATPFEIAGMPAMQLAREVTLVFPSDQQMLFIVVEDSKVPAASVVVPMMVSLLTGKSSLAGNAEMEGMVKGADKSGPVWVVGKPSAEMMRQVRLLAPFDSFVGSSKAETGKITLKLEGIAHPPEQAGVAMTMVSGILVGAISAVNTEAKDEPALKLVVDFLKSVKIALSPAGATGTAEVSEEIEESLLTAMRPQLWRLLQLVSDEEVAPGIGRSGGDMGMTRPN